MSKPENKPFRTHEGIELREYSDKEQALIEMHIRKKGVKKIKDEPIEKVHVLSGQGLGNVSY